MFSVTIAFFGSLAVVVCASGSDSILSRSDGLQSIVRLAPGPLHDPNIMLVVVGLASEPHMSCILFSTLMALLALMVSRLPGQI